jgi:hypothetical protein
MSTHNIPTLEQRERWYITRIVRSSPNLRTAAKLMGISDSTLRRKRELYNIAPPPPRPAPLPSLTYEEWLRLYGQEEDGSGPAAPGTPPPQP